MNPIYITAIVILCLIPLFYALYYFGIMVTRVTASWFLTHLSLPTRWEGESAGTTGLIRRNFAVFRKYSTLAVEYETNSGSIQVEVRAPDGSILSPASGVYGRDGSILIDVSQLKRCSVMLRMERFKGNFRIALQ